MGPSCKILFRTSRRFPRSARSFRVGSAMHPRQPGGPQRRIAAFGFDSQPGLADLDRTIVDTQTNTRNLDSHVSSNHLEAVGFQLIKGELFVCSTSAAELLVSADQRAVFSHPPIEPARRAENDQASRPDRPSSDHQANVLRVIGNVAIQIRIRTVEAANYRCVRVIGVGERLECCSPGSPSHSSDASLLIISFVCRHASSSLASERRPARDGVDALTHHNRRQ